MLLEWELLVMLQLNLELVEEKFSRHSIRISRFWGHCKESLKGCKYVPIVLFFLLNTPRETLNAVDIRN